MAESISGLRDRRRRSGVHLGVSEDGTAGFRHDCDPVYAGPALSRTEIGEGISAVLPKPRNFPGEHRESSSGRCGALGQACVGGGEGGLPAARRNLDGSDRKVAAAKENEVGTYFCNRQSEICNRRMLYSLDP